MSLLYVNEDGASIGVNSNRLSVQYSDGLLRSVPIETVDSITVLGQAQLTTQCIRTCLERGIPVAFFSKGGRYFGHLHSTGHVDAALQRKQDSLYEREFAFNLSRRLIEAKLKNQMVVLRRYEKSTGIDVSKQLRMIGICLHKTASCTLASELIGYEGQGAKAYFEVL